MQTLFFREQNTTDELEHMKTPSTCPSMEAYVAQNRGLRPYMEDTYSIDIGDDGTIVACVFDGHGGGEASDFLAHNFGKVVLAHTCNGKLSIESLTNVFDKIDQMIVNRFESGSTASIVVIRGNKLIFANCGDSMAYISGKHKVTNMSYEHKVSDPKETARLKRMGAQITYNDGVARINGALNISRSFGDRKWKQFVTARPYIVERRKRGVEYIMLATDGVWDVMDAHEIDNVVKTSSCKSSAANIIREAKRRGSGDNLTALVIYV